MKCPACNFDNPEGMRFCGACATALGVICTVCGFANPQGFRFCGSCGNALVSKGDDPAEAKVEKSGEFSQGSAPSPPMPRPGEAERRQLTVMFCDLVDSTPLSERLDPEVLRDVINDYQQVCGDVVTRYEGYIAQYLGDGLLIYFGFPQAHEDDAVRAVRAGLEMTEAVGRLSARLQKEKDVALSIRIGIHTGLVVIGEIGGPGRRERLALGETTNIAARLQSLAEPNTVVISEATRRLSGSYFEIASLGRAILKGFSVPVELHHVLGTSGIRSRYEASAGNGRTPFAGREKESRMLLEWWSRATTGKNRTVVISGEAGIGKSRLVDVLKQRIADLPHHLLEFHCSQYSRNSAFQPVIQTLLDVFGLSVIPPSDRLRHLEATLREVGPGHAEAIALVASLLGVDGADDAMLGELTPQRRRQRTIETVIDLLEAISSDLPSLVVVEDLHWSDPSSLDLLERLIERSQSMRVLTILTCRPSFELTWNSASRLDRIDLERLPQGDAEAMIIRLAAGRQLPDDVREQILARTDGIPLFVEELTKMVIESTFPARLEDRLATNTSLPHTVIPTTLNDSLMARLDRLGSAREIAQIGATIGRRFSYRLLESVSGIDEETIRAALDRLVDSELVTRQGTLPEAEFTFRHALIQDAAYGSLLHTRRQMYHREIARVLEDEFPRTLQMQPELLAHHYSMAAVVPRAIHFWQLAGQSAIERSAHTEAIHHLQAGLELLMTMPDGEQRNQQELTIRVMLGVPLMNRMGWGAPELVANYERALAICHCIEDSPHRFPILVGLAISAYIRGDLAHAAELGDRCIGIAESSGRTDLRLQAHRIQAPVLLWQGRFRKSRYHAGIAAELYDPVEHASHAHVYGHDPGSAAISYVSWLDWFLGFPDKALEASIRAMELARGKRHPQTLAVALLFATLLRQSIGDVAGCLTFARELAELSLEQEIPFWGTLATALGGWAISAEGNVDEGIAMMRRGQDEWRASGASLAGSYFALLLGGVLARSGRVQEAREIVDEGIAFASNSTERIFIAELIRIKAELLMDTDAGNVSEAEALLRRAISIAEAQQTLSHQLRASSSLYHLLRDQGRESEGRTILGACLARFTEGFDSPDLKRAAEQLALTTLST